MNSEKQEIKKTVISYLKKMTSKQITESSRIKELGIDSLDLVQAVTQLEEHYSIFITDDELISINSVSDIIQIIEKKIS